MRPRRKGERSVLTSFEVGIIVTALAATVWLAALAVLSSRSSG
jgi:hypothetical protein